MNKVKRINRKIIGKFIEIGLISIFVIASYFWWGSLAHLNEYRAYAESMSNYTTKSSLNLYTKESGNYDLIMPVTNEYAMANYQPKILLLENSFNTIRKYNLVAKIGKNSTLDYRFLNVSIDDKIHRLRNLEILEDENYIFVLFPEDRVKEQKKLEVRVWLDVRTPSEEMDKALSLTFQVKENGMAPV